MRKFSAIHQATIFSLKMLVIILASFTLPISGNLKDARATITSAKSQNLCVAMQKRAEQSAQDLDRHTIEGVTGHDFGMLQWPDGVALPSNPWTPVSRYFADVDKDGVSETIFAVSGGLGGIRSVELFVTNDIRADAVERFDRSAVKDDCEGIEEACIEPLLPTEVYKREWGEEHPERQNAMLIVFNERAYAGLYTKPSEKISIFGFSPPITANKICEFSSHEPSEELWEGE